MPSATLDLIALPAGIHACLYGEVRPYGISIVAVWADRPSAHCERCGQPSFATTIDDPWFVFDHHGEPEDAPHQCSNCGAVSGHEWTTVPYSDDAEGRDDLVAPGISAAMVEHAAAEMSASLTEARDDLAAEATQEARRDLINALTRLAESLGAGESADDRLAEVSTGSEVDEGVYFEGGVWMAWVYDPSDNSGDTPTDILTVGHNDLTDGDIPTHVLAAALAVVSQT